MVAGWFGLALWYWLVPQTGTEDVRSPNQSSSYLGGVEIE